MLSLGPTLLVILATLAWWFTEPKTLSVNIIAFGGLVIFGFIVAPDLTRDLILSAYTSYAHIITALRLDVLVLKHTNMLLTIAALVWYVEMLI